jgi:hypothetical protein
LSIGIAQILQIDGPRLAVWSMDLDESYTLLSVSNITIVLDDIVPYVCGSSA